MIFRMPKRRCSLRCGASRDRSKAYATAADCFWLRPGDEVMPLHAERLLKSDGSLENRDS
jgi:hypothetical protein